MAEGLTLFGGLAIPFNGLDDIARDAFAIGVAYSQPGLARRVTQLRSLVEERERLDEILWYAVPVMVSLTLPDQLDGVFLGFGGR